MNRIIIDGMHGGGQILRTALSLSAILGIELEIINIRGIRENAGLQNQHLQCVLSLAEITGAKVEGATLKSTKLIFTPPVFTGKRPMYNAVDNKVIEIGSSGSSMLVMQTLLPVLLFSCNSKSTITIKGGTHVGLSPSTTFIEQTFFPVLRQAGFNVDGVTKKYGFAPYGIGEFEFYVEPVCDQTKLQKLFLDQKQVSKDILMKVLYGQSKKPVDNSNFLSDLQQIITKYPNHNITLQQEQRDSNGFGIAVVTNIDGMILTSSDYKNNQKNILNDCEKQLDMYLKNDCFVDEFLADQLLLITLLGAGSQFRATVLSEHFVTNTQVLEQFFGNNIIHVDGCDVVVLPQF